MRCGCTTVMPLGLRKSLAIFANNLLHETPADAVRWSSPKMAALISAAISIASGIFFRFCVTSKKASSNDMGSMMWV